jgi:hypothetical protein
MAVIQLSFDETDVVHKAIRMDNPFCLFPFAFLLLTINF